MTGIKKPFTSEVARAFDAVAPMFEASFENEVTRTLRILVYASVDSITPPGSSILDINCGVGIDAVALSQRGYRVTGVDISPRMIGEARVRARKNGENISFHVASFDQISAIKDEQFATVLSNFGGLNCSGSLKTVCREVARVMLPGGHFLAVVMPRICLWEIAAGLARMNPHSAFRRFQAKPTATGFQQTTFRVYYHSLRNFVSASSLWFEVVSVRGLCVLAPPPHASTFRRSFPRFSRLLSAVDERIAAIPGLRGTGDHYLAILRRNRTAVQEGDS